MQLNGNINISFYWNVINDKGEEVFTITEEQKEQLLEATHERIEEAFKEGWRECQLETSIEIENNEPFIASGWLWLTKDIEKK